MMSSVEQLLRAAKYLEMQEGRHHQYGGCTPPDSPDGDPITPTTQIDGRNGKIL